MKLETPDVRACVSCIPSARSDVQCSCCCGTTNTDCELEWSWGAVLATLSVSAVFATCSGILALAEKRRKRKGLSLARAWSLPHGMPVVSVGRSGGGSRHGSISLLFCHPPATLTVGILVEPRGKSSASTSIWQPERGVDCLSYCLSYRKLLPTNCYDEIDSNRRIGLPLAAVQFATRCCRL